MNKTTDILIFIDNALCVHKIGGLCAEVKGKCFPVDGLNEGTECWYQKAYSSMTVFHTPPTIMTPPMQLFVDAYSKAYKKHLYSTRHINREDKTIGTLEICNN